MESLQYCENIIFVDFWLCVNVGRSNLQLNFKLNIMLLKNEFWMLQKWFSVISKAHAALKLSVVPLIYTSFWFSKWKRVENPACSDFKSIWHIKAKDSTTTSSSSYSYSLLSLLSVSLHQLILNSYIFCCVLPCWYWAHSVGPQIACWVLKIINHDLYIIQCTNPIYPMIYKS